MLDIAHAVPRTLSTSWHTGKARHVPLAWIGPRNPQSVPHFSLFLLPSNQMHHFFSAISPTYQFDELKWTLIHQNTIKGVRSSFLPMAGTNQNCSRVSEENGSGSPWLAPHGLGQVLTTIRGNSWDAPEMSEAAFCQRCVWWILVSDTVSEQNWKCVPLQLVKLSGPTFTRGFAWAASCLVPWKAEPGPPRLVSSLPEIPSMTQPVNTFVLLTSVHKVLQPGEKGGWRERKMEGLQCGYISSRIKMSTTWCLCLWHLGGLLFFWESLYLFNTHLLHILIGFGLRKRWIRKSLLQRNLPSRKETDTETNATGKQIKVSKEIKG